MDVLIRTWLILLILTAGTVVVGGYQGLVASAILLALSWGKARAIFGNYLHLGEAPGWLGFVMVPLAIWMALIWGLNAFVLR